MSFLSFLTGSKHPSSNNNTSSSSYHKFNVHPAYHKNSAVKSAFKLGVKTGRNQIKNR